MRDYEKSEFTKTIGIKPEKLDIIIKLKGKKSRAGMLDKIIDYYLTNKK